MSYDPYDGLSDAQDYLRDQILGQRWTEHRSYHDPDYVRAAYGYSDVHQRQAGDPKMSRRDAIKWMATAAGCLALARAANTYPGWLRSSPSERVSVAFDVMLEADGAVHVREQGIGGPPDYDCIKLGVLIVHRPVVPPMSLTTAVLRGEPRQLPMVYDFKPWKGEDA